MLRCRKVPVAKLEAATAEATAHIPLEKAPLLEEIYRVAKLEERYLAGGLGGFFLFLFFFFLKYILSNFSAVLMLTNPKPRERCVMSPLRRRSSRARIKKSPLRKWLAEIHPRLPLVVSMHQILSEEAWAVGCR